METIREQIIAAITTALADVRTVNGYNTNCGQNVARAAKKTDSDDLPAIVLWPEHETVSREYGNNVNVMPFRVDGLKAWGSSNLSIVAETILGDLIEIMTGDVLTVDYTSGGTYVVKIGDTITGADSGATAFVQSVALDSGTWAGENAAGTLTLRRLVGLFQAENLDVGANSNVATIAAAPTGSHAPALITDGLADSIKYISGGVEEYPDPEQKIIIVPVICEITYKTRAGDPYHQPA